MTKFRIKPHVFEASQWLKNGDHPEDGDPDTEGNVVRYYRTPYDPGNRICTKCGHAMHDHGWIDVPTDGITVCPGDWVVKWGDGEFFPCAPDIFERLYEPIPIDP